MLVTRDEHVGNDFPGYAAPQPVHGQYWIKIHREVRGEGSMVDAAYRPTTCNHCDNAPCIAKAGDGSVYKRKDGIVIIDPKKARGRKDLIQSCPYGAIWWNDELQLPQKWIFDAHLLDQGWEQLRCQQSCPTGVYRTHFVEDSEMQSIVEKEQLEVLQPELNTKPRVYYKNLYRFSKCFIGGSAVAEINGTLECIEGATAKLLKNGKVLDTAKSDAFGDFKFDKLAPNSGNYFIEVTHPQHGMATANATLEKSKYVGNMKLL